VNNFVEVNIAKTHPSKIHGNQIRSRPVAFNLGRNTQRGREPFWRSHVLIFYADSCTALALFEI